MLHTLGLILCALILCALILAMVLVRLMLWFFFLRSRGDPRGAGVAEAPALSLSSCSNARRRRDTLGSLSEATDSPERLLRLGSPGYPAAGFTAMVASSGFSGECLPPPIALFVDVSGTVGTKTISTVAEPPLCRSPKAHSTALWW